MQFGILIHPWPQSPTPQSRALIMLARYNHLFNRVVGLVPPHTLALLCNGHLMLPHIPHLPVLRLHIMAKPTLLALIYLITQIPLKRLTLGVRNSLLLLLSLRLLLPSLRLLLPSLLLLLPSLLLLLPLLLLLLLFLLPPISPLTIHPPNSTFPVSRHQKTPSTIITPRTTTLIKTLADHLTPHLEIISRMMI
jgi:hypothetical protein